MKAPLSCRIPRTVSEWRQALESFPYLMYIEVMAGNPAFYSDGGVLYKADGTLYVFPAGRNNWGAGDND